MIEEAAKFKIFDKWSVNYTDFLSIVFKRKEAPHFLYLKLSISKNPAMQS